MAGGVGSRFWPLSRKNKPKQFLDILGTGRSLLQMTFKRFSEICPTENIYIITNQNYTELVAEQIPEISEDQILSEPLRKNTAPCIAYSTRKIMLRDPEAVVVVAPSDHLIVDEKEFAKVIEEGFSFSRENDALITLGIEPTRPETGYGYIQVQKKNSYNSSETLFKAKTFTEKPDARMAGMFLQSGDFYWNAGIFIWSVKSISKAFQTHMNEMYQMFDDGKDVYNTEGEPLFIFDVYSNCQEISIDYAIMEKAENVFVITAGFGWSDLGTWGSLYDYSEKDDYENVAGGDNLLLYQVKKSIVKVPGQKLAVIQGLEGYIVVESEGILLICKRKDEQKIRQFVNDVQIQKGEEFV